MSFWCILVWSCCMRSLSHPLVFAYSPFQKLPGTHNRSILSTEQPIVATNLLNPQSPLSVSVDQPHPHSTSLLSRASPKVAAAIRCL